MTTLVYALVNNNDTIVFRQDLKYWKSTLVKNQQWTSTWKILHCKQMVLLVLIWRIFAMRYF